MRAVDGERLGRQFEGFLDDPVINAAAGGDIRNIFGPAFEAVRVDLQEGIYLFRVNLTKNPKNGSTQKWRALKIVLVVDLESPCNVDSLTEGDCADAIPEMLAPYVREANTVYYPNKGAFFGRAVCG